ncbi:exodeoxyribonuclease-3 [Reichenbachiella faecimaris]|uniref:Exodeoxyribonuclease-3 n=1 Tax=Reichenbachiella faecimaris TaxID=692418 RepID=A0A1W2GEF7_REIFA|nr:exodeoxyribonuclease III [Reichenbachiella faecimaris]SMD34728.1 exodeoxyribonuclease-3 [Reichenbachiella faecimaris]
MKIVSYNVNGVRAAIKKGLLDSFEDMQADIICLQETKAQDDQVLEALGEDFSHHVSANSAVKKGYSGTCTISKTAPISVTKGIGIEDHDQEGRVLTSEFEDFYVVNVYVPNSSRELRRLDYRKGWDVDFRKYLKGLEAKKPVIACGDFNVAHQEIDIARPKSNYNKTAGYTQVEIDGMTNFLEAGFVDTFRHLHPEEVAYSWWSYRAGAREKNIGWRIDYFLVSEPLVARVASAAIHPDYKESDHCPISLTL